MLIEHGCNSNFTFIKHLAAAAKHFERKKKKTLYNEEKINP